MLFVPQKGAVRVITNGGIVGSATPWTAVASGGTTLTYGTVTELISSTANTQDSWGLEVAIINSGASAAAAEAVVDLLIGGATDDVLAKSLICGYTYNAAATRYFFPVHIPAGKRIAVQSCSVRTSASIRVGIWLYGSSNPPFHVGKKITTYGTQANAARGVAITPTASGGAASVTQITASTTEAHFYSLPGFQAATDTTITPAGWMNIGIGIGAATEERIGTWWIGKDTTEIFTGPIPALGAFHAIPASSRLTILASNSGANDAAYDGLIYCV